MIHRRALVQAVALGLAGCASPALGKARVVVVGGGYGGATAAKYVRQLSGGQIEVVLVEPQALFQSCPLSDLVVAGANTLADVSRSYSELAARHGIRQVRDQVSGIDADKRCVTLASGPTLRYDRLVLSPGISFIWDSVEGLQAAQGQIVQAWKAGPETVQLQRQLQAMPDGGVFALTIPEAPYRCPPAPYERACLVAAYFKRDKPRSKVLILDANQDVTSHSEQFKQIWAEQYAGLIEYRPEYRCVGVEAQTLTLKFEVQDDVRADVLNVLPDMRAGAIAVQTGLANSNGRWCNVDFLNFESTAVRGIHVIGDSIQTAALMPKSGSMAHSQAKVLAAAIVAELSGQPVNSAAKLSSACYSFVDFEHVIEIASAHEYVAAERTFELVHGATPASGTLDATRAWQWARGIWNDMLD